MEKVSSREALNDGEIGSEQTFIENLKSNFNDWSRENLLDLLAYMETEMTSLEVAFRLLKAKLRSDTQSLKYGLYSALDSDGHYFIDDSKFEDLKCEFVALKGDLESFSVGRGGYEDKMKGVLEHLSRQYLHACEELSLQKDRWVELKEQVHGLQEEFKREKQALLEQLDQVMEDKQRLVERVEGLEEEVEVARRHREGAFLLVNERAWFCSKISAFITLVAELEAEVQALRSSNSRLSHKLEQSEAAKKSITDDEKERQNLYGDFEARMKVKDDEIIRLRQEISKQNLNHNFHLTPSLNPHNSPYTSFLASPKRTPEKEVLSTTTPAASTTLTTPSNMPSQGSPKQPPSITTASRTLCLDSPQLHRHHPGSQSMARIDTLLLNGTSSKNISGLNLESPVFKSPPSTLTSSSFSTSTFALSSPHNQPLPPSSEKQGQDGREGGKTRFNIFGAEMAGLQELISSATSKYSASSPSSPRLSPSFSSSTIIRNTKECKALDLQALQLHISTDDEASLRRLLARTPPQTGHLACKLPNGCPPVYFSVECASHACLELLLQHGWDADAPNTDQMSPVNLAATEGNLTSLAHLLKHGACVHQCNHIGMTPLHSAASNGHADCCLLLLAAGASVEAVNVNTWTPLHTATFSSHHSCLRQMLSFSCGQEAKDSEHREAVKRVLRMQDKDGCTLVHLAIVNESKECLEALLTFTGGSLELESRDRWKRTPLQIASPSCLRLLFNSDSEKETTCRVLVELQHHTTSAAHHRTSTPGPSTTTSTDTHLPADTTHVHIGSVSVRRSTEWRQLEEQLSSTFLTHISQVSVGIRSNKITKLEHALSSSSSLSSSLSSPSTDATPNSFSLGLSVKSVKYYSIGRLCPCDPHVTLEYLTT